MGLNTTFYKAGLTDEQVEALQDVSPTESGYIDGVTAGTAAASKAVVLDANKDVTGVRHLTSTGTVTAALATLTAGTNAGADIGGLLSVNTADSTAVTAASGDASTNETAFDVSYTVPANTLAAGDTLRVAGGVLFTDSDASAAGTATIKVKVDGQIIGVATGTLSNDIGGGGPAEEYVSFDLTATIRTSTTGMVTGSITNDIGGTAATAGSAGGALSSIDTTGTMAVTVTVQFGTEDSDNSATLKQLAVYRNA